MKKKRNVMSILKMDSGEILLKMKLLTLLIFAAFVSASASSYSQSVKFNLNMKEVSIRDVFQKIEEQSEFIILFNEKSLNVDRKVTVTVKDETVDKILDQIFNGEKDAYQIFDRQILISKLNEISKIPYSGSKNAEVPQPQKKELSGTVKDAKGLPLPGVTVMVKGTTLGIVTDNDGNFRLLVPVDAKALVFTFVGMKSHELLIDRKTSFQIVLEEEVVGMNEMVVVGYGTQKKSTLVGAVSQISSKELQRTGGVTNLAQALTGNLPGLTTIQSSSQPGASDPQIFIRGQSSWNSTSPYILVDGVERRMNDIDMNEVESVSILKDASATAVYGVKGANGVILITTKRGSSGKPIISVSGNISVKMPSFLLDKLDAYDAITVRDAAISKEALLNPASWNDFVPYTIRDRYRNQQNLKYPEAYPNIDWQKLMLKEYATDKRINLSSSGGNETVKYFTSVSYLSEADIFNGRKGYYGSDWDPGYGFQRFNFRSNVDINVTKTTVLSVNLAAIHGTRKEPVSANVPFILNSLYITAPDIYMPIYSNGSFGYSPTAPGGSYYNPYNWLIATSYSKVLSTNVTSDFILKQKLDFITQGLSATAKFSFDNTFGSTRQYNGGYRLDQRFIQPGIEDAAPGTESQYILIAPISTAYDYALSLYPWKLLNEAGDPTRTVRRIFYQGQLNYARSFNKHDIALTGVFTREQLATGSEFQRYREDWVFRGTYNFDGGRYFAELNGAYNGSEKFGPDYRFAFFPSVGLGWSIKRERFLRDKDWLDQLKLRYNFGFIGDDGITNRWLYLSQYASNGSVLSYNDYYNQYSPYTIYQQTVVGNPSVHWEKAQKTNYGFDFSMLKNLLSLNFDYFTENRSDILILGANRQLPPYYSMFLPTSNVGRVTKNGFEVVLSLKKQVNEDLTLWANCNMTHVKDKVVYKEEPQLLASQLLAAGFALNQTKSSIRDGFMQNWDQVYSSPAYATSDSYKLPGDFRVIDFNADGNYDGNKDGAPVGYSNVPQNTYSYTVGADYKGFSLMLQFYGVNNVTRNVGKTNFDSGYDIAYGHTLDYWSVRNPSGTSFLPRWKANGNMIADYYMADGSYLRLKNAEVAYTFDKPILKKLGMAGLRIYLNGANLLFWSKQLPDDREFGTGNAYPATKRINLGVDVKF